jgi:hypothetical protein
VRRPANDGGSLPVANDAGTQRSAILRRISALHAELAEHHAQLADLETAEAPLPSRPLRRVVPIPAPVLVREPSEADRVRGKAELERIGYRRTRKG